MSTNKIKIDHVTGGKNKDDLKNCYFEPSAVDPGAYDFYDKNGNRLARDLNVGDPFEFGMDGLTWVLYDWTSDGLHASGNWRNDGPAVDPALEQGGTFTAQAGGGVDGETNKPGRILPLEQITIVEVLENGVPIPSPLLGCFFSPQGAPDEYMFFEEAGKELHSKITHGEPFTIDFGGQRWELTAHFSKHKEQAHGTWKPIDTEEDGGTFTAQAGGGVPTAVSAYA